MMSEVAAMLGAGATRVKITSVVRTSNFVSTAIDAAMVAVLAITVVALCSGCALEVAQLEVRTRFHGAVGAFLKASETFARGADEMARMKHDMERAFVAERFSSWLDRVTSDDDGVVRVSRDVLERELADRDAAVKRVTSGEDAWRDLRGPLGDAVAAMRRANEDLLREEVETFEARRSAQAAADAALTALLSAAGAVGVGAVMVP